MSSKPTFRSSETDRILSCNGSITLVPLVARRQGTEGYEGTMLHWHIADRAVRELGAVPPAGGLPPPDVPQGYRCPNATAWMIEWAIRHIKESIPADWSLLVEVPLAYEFERFNLSGHIDLLAISPDGKAVKGIDWKTGRDPVDPADNNEQVAAYLALVKKAWPDIERGTFEIAQPLVDEDLGCQRVSRAECHNMDGVLNRMETAIAAAMDNAMEVNSGLKQCRWCPVGIQCPALQQELNQMKIKMNEASVALIKNVPDDALLGGWVETMRMLKRPSEDAEALLHERLDVTGKVVASSGTVIQRKIQNGTYEVPDAEAFMAAFKAILPDSSIPRTWSPSMTKIKDEIAAVQHIPKSGKSAVTAETVFDAHLRPHVQQNQKKVLVFQ